MPVRFVAVIDIGKTNAKLALVDLDTLAETAVDKTPNTVRRDGPYPHHDVERIWDFLLAAMARLAAKHRIDAISVTTHGATAALLDAQGGLALPVLDYEHDGLDTTRNAYEELRPDFAETGSPRLALGLNIGPQLFWQAKTFPDRFVDVSSILMYPQYWAFRLTGVRANELTSLGCHTDLWNPAKADYSSLVGRMGWREIFAPIRKAGDVLGPILPEIAKRTGLDPSTPVLCGIHDSNASLLPHLLSTKPPFSVVSTGTWVISMAVGARTVSLDPARDTLINVNAWGDPVPSARFMGGREFSTLTDAIKDQTTEADIEAVLHTPILLTPTVQQGCGPYPDRASQWLSNEPQAGAQRRVAASFYLAMMTAASLGLIGAEGPIIVEGPFAANAEFCRMLEAATGRQVRPQAQSTGASVGAALLAKPDAGLPIEPPAVGAEIQSKWLAYAQSWRDAVDG